jgi:hypothetical protein
VPFTNISNFYAKQIVLYRDYITAITNVTLNKITNGLYCKSYIMTFTNVAVQKITNGFYCESHHDFA